MVKSHIWMCFVNCKAQYTYKVVLNLALRHMVTDMANGQMCVRDGP